MGLDTDKRLNLRVTAGMHKEISDMTEWLQLRTNAECVRHLLAQALEMHKLKANAVHQTNVLEHMRDIQGGLLADVVGEMGEKDSGGISNTPTGEQNCSN